MSENLRHNLEVVGNEGRLGDPLFKLLQKYFEDSDFEVSGFDIKHESTEQTQNPNVLVLALPAERVATLYPEYANKLSKGKSLKVVINVNSVQNKGREVLLNSLEGASDMTVVVNIHPYFGPRAFTDLADKKLIYCGADVVGGDVSDQQRETANGNWRQIVDKLAQDLPKQINQDAEPMEVIDLSTKTYEVDGKEIKGAKLHDYIATYGQAPYHILRLALTREGASDELVEKWSHKLPLDLEWKFTSKELTQSIVDDNEYATKEANALFAGEINEDRLVAYVRESKQKLEHVTKEVFPGKDLNYFATANVVKLFEQI